MFCLQMGKINLSFTITSHNTITILSALRFISINWKKQDLENYLKLELI